MSASQRRYAIQSRTSSEADRIDFMVRHMAANKAYRYAAAGGDANGSILAAFNERYRNYRANWRGQPRRAIEEGLTGAKLEAAEMKPLCMDIEVASICDLACPFCFRQHIVTPDKIIDADVYKRLIDQCAELDIPSLKLNWRGEPLLHPKLPEFIDYAKRNGVLEVIINTNATTLNETKAQALIEAGLDQMIYSFDGGSKETYESMRVGRFKKNNFDAVYGNIRRFSEIRDELGSVFPRTKIQMILTEQTFDERETFYDLFEDCVDDVSVKAYTERGGSLPDLDADTRAGIEPLLAEHGVGHNAAYWRDIDGNLFISKGRLPCEQPFQRLMATYDGRISMCCYDWGSEHPIGYVAEAGYKTMEADHNAVQDAIENGKPGFSEFMATARMPTPQVDTPRKVETLKEIWYGGTVDDARRKQCEGKIDDVEICTRCPFKETYDWLEVTPTG
ncbi:MAG: radical SAM/SPASM domain-containing protein [Pseudomonadota bacterium]|nr:radical SAM/SPASM domain-containing protein [Pseudomonadota bacterium]